MGPDFVEVSQQVAPAGKFYVKINGFQKNVLWETIIPLEE